MQAEKWRDLLNSKHVTGGLCLKTDALYGSYISGLTKHKLASLQDCEAFLASVISASQSFGTAFHTIVTFDVVRVPQANPSALRCFTPSNPSAVNQHRNTVVMQHGRYTKVHLVRLSPSVGEASLIAQASKAPLPKDKAMTAWSSVMLALASAAVGKAPVVPSRESVMTRLLHDAMVMPLFKLQHLSPDVHLPTPSPPPSSHATGRSMHHGCNRHSIPVSPAVQGFFKYVSLPRAHQRQNPFPFFSIMLRVLHVDASAMQTPRPCAPTPPCCVLTSPANGCPLLEEGGVGRACARASLRDCCSCRAHRHRGQVLYEARGRVAATTGDYG